MSLTPIALNRQIRRFSAGAGAVVAAKEGVDFRIVATDDGRHGFEVIDKTPAEDKLANGSRARRCWPTSWPTSSTSRSKS